MMIRRENIFENVTLNNLSKINMKLIFIIFYFMIIKTKTYQKDKGKLHL